MTLPTTVEEIKRIIEKIKLQGLNDFLFMMIKLFRRTTLQEFSKELAHTWNMTGKRAEHSSPLSLNALALKILNVSKYESLLDPTCGYGNAIISLLKQNPDQKIFGQEISTLIAELTKIRTTLLDASHTTIEAGDVLENPRYIEGKELKRFDTVFGDSPIGLKKTDLERLENDPYNRFKYGLPPKSRMDWAFISNGISSLNETGKGVFVTSLGPLFRSAMEQKNPKKSY